MRVTLLALVALGAIGCSGGSDPALDNAAPPTTDISKAPPPVPGKTATHMGPLTGPNAGKGGGIPGE